MIHRPPASIEAAARKRGAARLAAANREKALEVRYGMRDHYPKGAAMRTEAEVKEALELIRAVRALCVAHIAQHGHSPEMHEIGLMQNVAEDLLKWLLLEPNGFEKNIVEPGRRRMRNVKAN